jgi:RNA polymerase sigma-70 factor (ECF subfamily)
MGDAPETRHSLLARLRQDQDHDAWVEFVEIYAPLVYGLARRQGLQDADAADVTQDTLRAVASAIERLEYDPDKGSFRAWLFTIARNKLRTHLARENRRAQGAGSTSMLRALEGHTAPDEDARERWDEEYERSLFELAARRIQRSVQDSTWQAFWQSTVEARDPVDVAGALNMTVANVYRAKSRVIAKLKLEVQRLRDE